MNAPTPTAATQPRLTSLSHGGGCGCKIAPGVLSEILKGMAAMPMPKELLVGIETADDAAVYPLNDEQAPIATTDFFMPINVLSTETIGKILLGGQDVCRAAGIPIAGGHTTDSVAPIYGLVGLVHPRRVKRNADAKAGDRLILGKPIGVGVLLAALKKDALSTEGCAQMIANTTRLNTPGPDLAALDGVRELAAAGMVTGASDRNWAACGREVRLGAGLQPVDQALLSDPQTSGGLLVACAPDAVDAVLAIFEKHGFAGAADIGEIVAPVDGVRLEVN